MSQINFVDEFRSIMETCRRESLPAKPRLLWIALFYLANDRARKDQQTGTWEWPDDFFPVNNAELAIHCPLEKRAMLEARNRLKQLGVIDFRSGDNANRPAKYLIRYQTFCQRCKNVPQDVPQGVPHYINNKQGINQRDNTHDDDIVINARARDRLSSTYLTENGEAAPCRYDSGFLVSPKARGAVAQRILGGFFGDVDVENAHATLCGFLEDGMPPELAEDCIDDYHSMSQWLAHVRKIYMAGRYEEKRDALEKAKLARMVGGSESAAEWLFRNSERYQKRYGDGD